MQELRKHLTYGNVVATLCLFLLLGGGAAIAAGKLGKNTVGSKQLKKNAVITAKIKKEAVTGGKVKKDTLTGTQINEEKLGTVPSANVANSVPPSQIHVVGAPGEPAFQSGTTNFGSESGLTLPGASFFKDRDNVVNLEGVVKVGKGAFAGEVFQLPAGFRPPSGQIVILEANGGTFIIAGSNVSIGGFDISGEVITEEEEPAILTGITFFAGS